jgi:hypothetical protein
MSRFARERFNWQVQSEILDVLYRGKKVSSECSGPRGRGRGPFEAHPRAAGNVRHRRDHLARRDAGGASTPRLRCWTAGSPIADRTEGRLDQPDARAGWRIDGWRSSI